MTITTFDEALAAVRDRSGYDRGFISDPFAGDDAARLGLLRTQAMLDQLGNPERACRIVHVAGSKGKGSTCMFIDGILRGSGLRRGRFLSPHLHSFLERFVVDDAAISEDDFTVLSAEVVAAMERVERDAPDLGRITAWELSTVMALRHFQQARCDVAVIEVGLGGTLDATNVVDPAVSVITALDFEHTAILGTTMTEIAGNKAGIIKPGRPVVTAAQPDDASRVIRERADACNAPLLVAGRDWTVSGTDRDFTATGPWGAIDHLRSSLAGWHQAQNAALAIAAAHTLGVNDPSLRGIDHDAMRAGIATAHLPGRFERVRLDTGGTVIIDGAHARSATAALADTMRTHYPDADPVIVVGMLNDKDPALVLPPLLGIAAHWIAVTPESPRAMPPDEVGNALRAMGAACTVSTTVAEGLGTARELGYATILVTGSFTTAAEARVALGLDQAPGDGAGSVR